jgi:hypothetical protein
VRPIGSAGSRLVDFKRAKNANAAGLNLSARVRFVRRCSSDNGQDARQSHNFALILASNAAFWRAFVATFVATFVEKRLKFDKGCDKGSGSKMLGQSLATQKQN